MIQIPDISPAFKGGIVGFLLFLVVSLVVVIGWLIKNGGLAGSKQANELRELRAGEKDAAFWQKDYDTRAAAQTRIILEYLGKLRARLREIEAKFDQHDESVKQDFIQVRRDIAMLAREVELKDRDETLSEK